MATQKSPAGVKRSETPVGWTGLGGLKMRMDVVRQK